MQDSKGYMWFATDAGVCRYDGYTFRSFTSEHGLPDNTIFDLYEDKKGRIWFWGMAKKLSYYNPATDSIHTLACNDSLSWHIENTSITSLYVDGDTIYLGVNSGSSFFKILPAANYKKVSRIYFTKSGWQVCCFKNNHVIWGTTSLVKADHPFHLSMYQHGKPVAIFDRQLDSVAINRVERYRHFVKTRDGFLLSEDETIYGADRDSLYHMRMSVPIISLYIDRDGDLWCGTKTNGLLRYRHGNLHSKPEHYLFKTSVTSIVQDHEGGYWFSTLEHGVYYAPSFVFSYYDQSAGLSGSKVYSVLSFGRKTYCLSEDGCINMIDDSSVSIQERVKGNQLYCMPQNNEWLFITGDSSRFYNVRTKQTSLVADSNGKAPYFLRKASISGKRIFAITSDGICEIDPKTAIPRQLIKNYHRLTAIYATTDTIWFGSPTGLYALAGGRVIHPGDEEPLLKNRVDDICMDGRRRLWLATKGAGILIKQGTRIHQLSTQNGLPSNLCRALMPDSGSVMWAGTNRGISRITWLHDTTYAIDNYSGIDGLLSDEINELSMNGNYIYAATNQGLVKFDKTQLQFSEAAPPIYITDFYVNELRRKIAQRYVLDHHENFIRIGFLGLSYKTPGQMVYKYKLLGLDTSWKYTKNVNVQFTTLPPGNYTFVVYAISHKGLQSEMPATILFHINEPFWRTWWFIIGNAILILICIYAVFSIRIRRIKNAEAEKTIMNKKLAEMELRAIRAQMNPHFIFNSINSIQLFILMNDADTAYRYLSKFSKLIRNVLENSKRELISLKVEIETLELYIELEKLRFETRFDHEIIVDSSLDTEMYGIPPLLVQPYVENAIWHGLMPGSQKGRLNITFTDAGELIKCMIEDNGIGREQSEEIKAKNRPQHKSLALSLSRERLEIIGHLYQNKLQINVVDLKDSRHQAAGTRVELYIPKIKLYRHDNSHYSG